jgi:UDP-N-acetylglucosamine:LPS N-acetylglucosamine transferase
MDWNILFIPTTSRDCAMFVNVMRIINNRSTKRVHIQAISLESINKQGITEALYKLNIPFSLLENYKTFNVMNIIRKEKPDLIIICHDGSATERSFIIAAESIGIPSLMIQVGNISQVRKVSKIYGFKSALYKIFLSKQSKQICNRYLYLFITCINLQKNKLLGTRYFCQMILKDITSTDLRGHYCKNIAATGLYDKKIMINEGIDENKIFTVGNPKFDDIFYIKYDINKIYNHFNVKKDKKIVLFLTQAFVEHGLWTEKQRDEFTLSIVETVKEMSEIQLIVKLHPLENVDVYKKIFTKMLNEITICQNEVNLYELINASDVVMSVASTASLEAMILDKPIITLNLNGGPNYIPYVEDGTSIGVYNKEDLVPAIKDALYNEGIRKKLEKERSKYVYEYAYIQDGKASERIVDLIFQIIGKSKKTTISNFQ